jgi:hypothetical protein
VTRQTLAAVAVTDLVGSAGWLVAAQHLHGCLQATCYIAAVVCLALGFFFGATAILAARW